MRRLAIGLVWAVFAPATFAADTDAVVVAKEVNVYSAPGDAAPETGTLPKGTRLQVHHEEPGGWLAVQPPNGSISWVNHRFLDFGDSGLSKLPATATIRCGDAGIEIEAGKFYVAGPLNVRRTKLANETVVTVMGPRVQWAGDNSYWYPIWSQPGDYRYVKRDGIQVATAAVDRMVVQSSGTMENRTPPIVTTRPAGALPPLGLAAAGEPVKATKPANWPNNPLWTQAETADKAGDLDGAEHLYFQLAGEMSKAGGDADLGNLCYSRIHAIRERRRAKGNESVSVKLTST
ncbi:MAG TPA: SH3 domain-containing protein, partial [Fimbriiglobus sp.]